MPRLRVGAAQLNAVVGDLDGNAERAIVAYEAAVAEGCDLVVFPELMITGYPPEDLLLEAGLRRGGERDGRQVRGPHRRMRSGHRLPRASGRA